MFTKSALFVALLICSFSVPSNARIRLRKVKEAPRVCQNMQEDKLLSRKDKKVLSTERHSVIFEDTVSLVRDKGEKICSWRASEFDSLGAIDQFKFYIDEYKEVLYSYIKNPDESFLIITTPFSTCSLETRVTLPEFQQPKCDIPKKKKTSARRKKKKAS